MCKPPVGVRLVLRDGTEIPATTVRYDGLHDGCHRWVAHWADPVPGADMDHVAIGELPGRTEVRFEYSVS